jgi:hypothetical protein
VNIFIHMGSLRNIGSRNMAHTLNLLQSGYDILNHPNCA